MTSEILAKIFKIAQKTGEKVIFVDSASGNPFVLMGLSAYEALIDGQKSGLDKLAASPLTASRPSGMIDPDLAFLPEKKASAGGQWGGDDAAEAEEDRYYMEPTE